MPMSRSHEIDLHFGTCNKRNNFFARVFLTWKHLSPYTAFSFLREGNKSVCDERG